MSVQKYETDILQEHVDSTPILIQRLEQWRKALQLVFQYIQGYEHIHAGVTAHLEKTLKNITELPSFSEPHEQAGASNAEGSSPSALSNVFQNLQLNVNTLLQRSSATTNGIKTSILPHLEQVQADIDKHYKALKIQGGKGIKEIERARESTQKYVEQLGRVTSSFGTRPLSYQEDPYILHRRVDAAVVDQIAKENVQAEAALGVQRGFQTLEHTIIETLRQCLLSLSNLNEGFDNDERNVNATIAKLFADIDLEKEWAQFSMANAEHLVPSSNYQRDPQYVTFVNKGHTSAQPIIQGPLQRKGTVLKSYNPGYYVLTPSGYLYQFKAADPSQDSTPEMGLYIPECQISKGQRVGEYTFKIVGKDAQKKITTRHKFAFKATSQQEVDQWYAALSRITGNVGSIDDDDDDVGSSPVSPVPHENSATFERPAASVPATAVPATTAFPAATANATTTIPTTAAAVPTTEVPTSSLAHTTLGSAHDELQ